MCHNPIKAIKLPATINPYNAGTNMPIFLMDGEKTEGKLNTTVIKPMMQMADIILGLVIALI